MPAVMRDVTVAESQNFLDLMVFVFYLPIEEFYTSCGCWLRVVLIR